jgi:hypothetical protein
MISFLRKVSSLFEIESIVEVVLNFCFFGFFVPNLIDIYFLFSIDFRTNNCILFPIVLVLTIYFFALFFILIDLFLMDFAIMNMSLS